MEKNIIINKDCESALTMIPDNSVHLVVTSPPYADKRKHSYQSIPADKYAEWLLNVSRQIMQILSPTGSFVLNVKEGCQDGIRQTYVLDYMLAMAKEFLWVEQYIWYKTNPFPTGSKRRLKDGWEHCLHFAKTKDYQFFPDNVSAPSQSVWANDSKTRKNQGAILTTNGSGMNMSRRPTNNLVRPSNVLSFPKSCLNINHPAVFPFALPEFFIKLMTKEGDLVCDPFAGSGTTLLVAKGLNRDYIGIESEKRYVELAQQRLDLLHLPISPN